MRIVRDPAHDKQHSKRGHDVDPPLIPCGAAAEHTWSFGRIRKAEMRNNADHIDDCVYAFLLWDWPEGERVCKSFDWVTLDQLHKKGLISAAVRWAKSVILRDEGLDKGERPFRDLFVANP